MFTRSQGSNLENDSFVQFIYMKQILSTGTDLLSFTQHLHRLC